MADAGVVAVRFTIANAEVVRQALIALGKDGEKALTQFDTSAQPAQEQLNALGAIIDVVRGRAAGLAAQGGGVASAITRWGPAGLAAGAGLGAATVAITKMMQASEEFAAKAQGIRDLANVLGLTTLQVQALNDAGGRASLTQEDMSRAMGRFAGLTQDARKAQGDFFETVRRINPELADQLLRTTDQAQALDLLAAAYAKAGTGAQRAELAKLLGKDAAAFGNLLQQIHAAGGVNAFANTFSLEAIPPETIEKVTRLRIEIAQIKERTANIWSGMFAADVLENQRRSAQFMLEIAEAAERAAKARKDWLEAEREAAARGDRPSISDAPLPPGFEQGGGRPATPLPQGYPGLRDVPLPTSAPARPQAPVTAEARLKLLRDEIALLGAAATPAEQYKLRLAEINAAAEKGGVSQETYNRATFGAAVAFQRAGFAIREQIGVLNEESMLRQRLFELDELQAQGWIRNAQERADAERLVRKEVRETVQALEVRKSATPALTQLAQEAGDLTRSLDSGLAGALRGTTSDLYAMFAGTETLGKGASNLAARLAEATAQAIIMQRIVGPFASAISGLIPGAAPVTTSGPNLQGGVWPSALGNVFNDGRIIPFKSGGVITRPILFPMANGMGLAGEAGEEGILPLRRGGDGRLGVSAYGGGGAPTVRMFIEDRAGVSITRRSAPAGFDMGILIDSVDQGLAQRQQDGTGAHAQVLKQDFGVERKFR
ncbi:MAG: phage tail tape measure protein [Pseudolabrys sp.]